MVDRVLWFGASGGRLVLPMLVLLPGLLALAGCAQSACGDPDVLAFVDRARQSRDLYAVGLLPGQVRETPVSANRKTAICSAWLLSRNPAWQPENHQPRLVRLRQDFWVSKLPSGYEVRLTR